MVAKRVAIRVAGVLRVAVRAACQFGSDFGGWRQSGGEEARWHLPCLEPRQAFLGSLTRDDCLPGVPRDHGADFKASLRLPWLEIPFRGLS